MKLGMMKEAAYGDRLYKMPSDETILREAKWDGGSFQEIKTGYEALWRMRHGLRSRSSK
jgi:hypothetical protein